MLNIKDAIEKVLNTLPKSTLITLVIIFAFLWSNDKIKENNRKQEEIIENQQTFKTDLKTISTDLKTTKTNVIDGFREQRTEINAINEKQKVVIETLPSNKKIIIDQINKIYDQIRKEQEQEQQMLKLKDLNKESNSIDSISQAIPPDLYFDRDTTKSDYFDMLSILTYIIF